MNAVLATKRKEKSEGSQTAASNGVMMTVRAAASRLIDLDLGCGRDGEGQWGDVERAGLLLLAAGCNQIGRDDCKTILSA